MRHALPVLLVIMPATALAQSAAQGTAPTTPVASVFTVTPVATFDQPWAMAFLPNGRLLVTEKAGRLRVVAADGTVSAPLPGLPAVQFGGQNGLFDVVAHPNFGRGNRNIYISFAEPGPGGTSGLAVGFGRYVNDAIVGFKVIWRDPVKVGQGGGHMSARLAFGPDKMLYVTSGDRQAAAPAQDIDSAKGKILRMTTIGWAPATNPFTGSLPKRHIWSMGHRNAQGLAFDGAGQLWSHEHGPQGGDEINLVVRGSNYGWPLVSNGRNYGAPTDDIPNHDTTTAYAAPKLWWNPSLAPSGLIIYSGSMFPAFVGNAFVGALGGNALIRVTLSGSSASETVRYAMGARIREVDQGPDGAIWVLEDGGSGRLLKLTPKL